MKISHLAYLSTFSYIFGMSFMQDGYCQEFNKRAHHHMGISGGMGTNHFINTGGDNFDKSFGKFNTSLDNTAGKMRRDYDRSEKSAAERYKVNAQANQIDTVATSQQAFANTQIQAVQSGGLYNQPANAGFYAPAVYGRYYGRRGLYSNPGATSD